MGTPRAKENSPSRELLSESVQRVGTPRATENSPSSELLSESVQRVGTPRATENSTKNCVHCNWELATMSGEVNVRFIELLGSFDRKNAPVCGRKVGQVT